MDGVEKSKLDKAIDQAQRLYDDSAGKVADGETRQTLLNAIRQRDGKAIGTAVKQVNDSMQAKTEADQEKHAAEEEARRQAEAAQAQAQQQAQQQTQRRQTVTPRRNYNYGGGSGGGPRTYKPATPTPSPAPTPAAPSKPSGNDGAFVG
jgi:colicin import membrane protein